MSKEKPLSKMAIASKLKAKKPFRVSTKLERIYVLTAAKYLEVSVSTRADGDGFNVFFV
jgi:hypothetical protein